MEECYVFAPVADESHPPSRKRRKTAHSKSTEYVQTTPFVPLMKGCERDDSVECRYEILEDLWRPQEEAVQSIFDHASKRTIESIKRFVDDASHQDQRCKIPTGLLLQGPENSASVGLFNSLAKTLCDLEHTMCITLTSGQSSNLKTVLKYINLAATNPIDGGDETTSKGRHLLNYDLQILCDHVNWKAISKVVLLFEDSEAFDGGLLLDLIDLLSSWNDRIPFVLLFGIATSVDLFQSKLSRNAIRCLEGSQFDVEQVDMEDVFRTVHSGSTRLFLGPGLSKLLIERQRDFIQNPQALMQALKYAYMTHFFSNPFSVWLDPLRASRIPDQEHWIAIRHLASFRRFLQESIDANEYNTARKLLDEDVDLSSYILLVAKNNPETLRNLVSAVGLFFMLNSVLQIHNGRPYISWSEVYILAMSNKLSDSALLEDILISLKRLKSNVLQDFLKSIPSEFDDSGLPVRESLNRLADLMAQSQDDTVLRSGHDIQHSNLRTTVVAQKVELSRHAAKVTAQEATYTKIIDRFVSELEFFFQSRFIDPQALFLHEVFIYDVKSLHREVFMPRPRFAIERALSSPHDYLGCDCCDGAAGGLSASQPATAIVYQLYLESGSAINTTDLWVAFWTIVGSEESGNDEERKKALALFSRALAELKFLGMIKNSRKKADHLAKLSWKGL